MFVKHYIPPFEYFFHTYKHIYMYMYANLHKCMWVCIHTHIYIHTYVHTYVHTVQSRWTHCFPLWLFVKLILSTEMTLKWHYGDTMSLTPVLPFSTQCPLFHCTDTISTLKEIKFTCPLWWQKVIVDTGDKKINTNKLYF